jgi:sirohydrochlorin ferrochelatase
LILLAHGSRDASWRKSLHALAEAVQRGSSHEEVRVAFMQFDGPSLPEVVENATKDGHTTLRLMPLFMASAGHVDKDIKPLVAELAEAYPGTKLSLMTPLGEDERLPRFIIDLVTSPSGQD